MILNNNFVRYVKWHSSESVFVSKHMQTSSEFSIVKTDSVTVETEHVYIKDNISYFIPHRMTYYFEPNVQITNLCIYPQISKYVNIEEISTYHSIAEIGVRYGSSAKWIIENSKELEVFDLYECNSNYVEIIKQRLLNYKTYSVYEGDASVTLGVNSHVYDLVFFDCSHVFDIDIRILNQLKPHISSNTTLIFDDFYLPDVKRLVNEAKKINCNMIYKVKY